MCIARPCTPQANVGLGKLFEELYRSIYLNYDEMFLKPGASADSGLGEKPSVQAVEPIGVGAQEVSAVPVQMWAGMSPVRMQMWQGSAQFWCRCGRGERSPGADVAGASAVPVQMWARGRAPVLVQGDGASGLAAESDRRNGIEVVNFEIGVTYDLEPLLPGARQR